MRVVANAIRLLRPATCRRAVLARHYVDLMRPRPGPPRLGQEEQDEFERLLEKANSGAFAPDEKAPGLEPVGSSAKGSSPGSDESSGSGSGSGSGVQSPYSGRTIPEFEGDVNPKTGEVGGPKQDPLRHGDYSFNGRVTDF
ncbi:hypothetical protein V1517DRAFT_254997 [Lipomyces orientalis]|uniref:Uncharacterized protein n=1 Tax=Lipomyces orientalis TaxID=1233043 RepID=A0ACC3TVD0_9ASCO